MLKINSAIFFIVFSGMGSSLYASQPALSSAKASIRNELGKIYAALDDLESVDVDISEISQKTHDSEFKQSCGCLDLDDCNLTSEKFKQAYFRAIANKKIDKPLLKLPWDEYIQRKKVLNLYRDIDKAKLYFIDFFRQQRRLIKHLRCINEHRVHGREISTNDEILLFQSIRTISSEALALIEDDLFRMLSPEHVSWLTIDQLAMLPKSKVALLLDNPHKLVKIDLSQCQALRLNRHFINHEMSAPVPAHAAVSTTSTTSAVAIMDKK